MTQFNLEELLRIAVERKASDIHLAVGVPPVIRVFGDMIKLDKPALKNNDIWEMMTPAWDEKQREMIKNDWELDFSYAIPGLSRFRGSGIIQRGSLDVVMRVIPWQIPLFEELGLPAIVQELARLPRGLVLVTGPTGSGKSTTLAAMVGQINEEQKVNILTIEHPIEFLHTHRNSIIRQREVGHDTKSFGTALRNALRHDPDVILIGEMRDQESIAIALTSAETGHMVFSTLHTQTAPLAVQRIVDVFPDSIRNYVRLQLADTLKGVISQQILPRADGNGRVAAIEVLVATPAVSNMIREGQLHQLYTAMQTGRSYGMQTMDSALADLVMKGLVTREEALSRSVNKTELERLLR